MTANVTSPSWQDDRRRLRAGTRGVAADEFHRLIADNISDGVLLVGVDNACHYASRSMSTICGYDPDELIGTSLVDLLHPDDQGRFRALHDEARAGVRDCFLFEFRATHRDGRWVWLEVSAQAVLQDSPGERRVIGSVRDIRWRKLLEQQLTDACEEAEENARQLHKLATTDPLTGLANRRHFMALLDAAVARVREDAREDDRSGFALAMIDIDFFKAINDSHGHAGGDAVLQAAAAAMQRVLRGIDAIGRIGGEEFAVLLPGADADTAAAICERLRTVLAAEPIPVPGGAAASVTVSIGMAQWRDESADGLLARADMALYRAKAEGRNRLVRAG
jgi:diguanylate cyclase (GGDEF)-like protein/PAS domain S-box-containing protein